MCEEMGTTDDILRRKVLIEINEDFHQADKMNFALQSDILAALIACFSEKNDEIRELASGAVLKVANTEFGRQILVDNELLLPISERFDDKVEQIRFNCYKCLINLAAYTFGIDAIIDTDILRILVDKLVNEKEERILLLILKLMNILLEGEMATPLLLNTPVLVRLNTHLESGNWTIRQLAAENLGSISYNTTGKECAIEAMSIPPLCKMLTDSVSEVRMSAVRALTSLAQLKEGKIQIYDLDKLN